MLTPKEKEAKKVRDRQHKRDQRQREKLAGQEKIVIQIPVSAADHAFLQLCNMHSQTPIEDATKYYEKILFHGAFFRANEGGGGLPNGKKFSNAYRKEFVRDFNNQRNQEK